MNIKLLRYTKMAGALGAHASALRDSLIDGMSFGSRPTASYIINRRSVSFPPQSGGVFSPNSLRLIRFSLQDATDGGSSCWLDGETLRLAFVVQNLGAKALQFQAKLPASLFRRCRVMCGGVEIMDLLDYGRCVEMFENLMPWGRQINDCAEGFGSMTGGSVYNTGGPSNFTLPFMSLPINAGAARRVLTQLLCPFFTGSQKLLPLALCGGLVIELELDDMYACFASVGDADNTAPPNWQIIQPMILVDAVQVDPAPS